MALSATLSNFSSNIHNLKFSHYIEPHKAHNLLSCGNKLSLCNKTNPWRPSSSTDKYYFVQRLERCLQISFSLSKNSECFFLKKSRRVFGSVCNVFIGGKCDKDIYAFLSLFWRFMYRRMFRSACNVFGGVRNVCSLICFFPALISRLAIYLPQNVLLLFAFLCLHHHHHHHHHHRRRRRHHHHASCIMRHVSCIIHHISCVMCHVSCVKCVIWNLFHVSFVICHLSCVMCHFFNF